MCSGFCPARVALSWKLPGDPLTSTWPHLKCDVGLEEGEYREKRSLSCSIVYYYYSGAQRYEQFLQVVDCIGLWSCLV